MKEYASVVLNGYTTKLFLDKALNELASQGFSIHSTIMGNIIIMEREETCPTECCQDKCQK